MAVAVISLMQTLEQLLHPQHYDLRIHKLVKTFQNKLCVLRDFIQNSCAHGNSSKSLEIKIINAAREADDIISSSLLNIRNQVEGATRRFPDELGRLIAEIDSIMKEVTRFEKKGKRVGRIERGKPVLPSPQNSPYRNSYPTAVVGLDGDFRMIKDRLRNSPDLQVVTIVGMGGIGKTTLAKSVYHDLSVAEHFDRCAWITVSQEYQERQVYLGILRCFFSQTGGLDEKRNDELAEQVYKSLKGRRYLIVLDDVWNTTTWDDLRRLFPNDGTGSRIILTTRLVEVALYASSGKPPHHMHFLSIEQGWELLSAKVFGKECCPHKLEEIGKQIVFKCGGLPLAIVVVAGLLSKVNNTIDDWKNVLENLNALVSSSAEDCFGILGLSYHQLPRHLKSCFVYTALFPEDALIPVPKLIKLWIAEGLVEGRSLEEVAETCLEELIDRSLVLICKHGSDGKAKTCMVHDLLREFCLREANAQKFLLVINSCDKGLPAAMKCHIRFGFLSMKWEDLEKILEDSAPNMSRSILSFGMSCILHRNVKPNFGRFKLLRVLDASSVRFSCYDFMGKFKDLIYLRYLAVSIAEPSFHFFINEFEFECLQTFIVHNVCPTPTKVVGPIYKMAKLRHLKLGSGSLSDYKYRIEVLFPNLQTFSGLCPSSCGRELFRHFPNLKKLGISYFNEIWEEPNCLASVHLLHGLVVLKFQNTSFLPHYKTISQKLNLPDAFPSNLKKLTLYKSCLPWKDMTILARLPSLEVLKLKDNAFTGEEWETTEESFQQLKVLVLEYLDLVRWRASTDYFQRLQLLTVKSCYQLEGIPREIGDITTLQEIELNNFNRSTVMDSAQEILEEQRNWGNDQLQLRLFEELEME